MASLYCVMLFAAVRVQVEIIGICWDALDGATLYQLLVTTSGMSAAMDTAARLLMFFWYLSVGCRLAMMFCSHLTPESRVYQVSSKPLVACDGMVSMCCSLLGSVPSLPSASTRLCIALCCCYVALFHFFWSPHCTSVDPPCRHNVV